MDNQERGIFSISILSVAIALAVSVAASALYGIVSFYSAGNVNIKVLILIFILTTAMAIAFSLILEWYKQCKEKTDNHKVRGKGNTQNNSNKSLSTRVGDKQIKLRGREPDMTMFRDPNDPRKREIQKRTKKIIHDIGTRGYKDEPYVVLDDIFILTVLTEYEKGELDLKKYEKIVELHKSLSEQAVNGDDGESGT